MLYVSQWIEYEDELREKIPYIELLGELDISQEWTQQFNEYIAFQFGEHGSVKALRLLAQQTPTCLAVYLVARGIYSYQEGNYWSGVVTGFDLSSANEQFLRQFFAQFLEDHQLPTFSGVGGRKYVDVILLHGGIPNYSLSDFFAYILLPALNDPELDIVDAQNSFTNWLETKSYSVNKPITRFLQYGGKFAADFVSRSLDLCHYYDEYQTIRTSEEIGLPQRVVEAYQVWIKQKIQAQTSTRTRLSRPALYFDPWGERLLIELPIQMIAASSAQGEVAWHIQSDHEERTISVNTTYVQQDDIFQTESCQFELLYPATKYRITLITFDTKPTWTLQGLTEDIPMMVFDAGNGRLLSIRESLAARTFWFLYSRQNVLNIVGGKKSEEFPAFSGAWAAFKAEEWDLSAAISLEIGGSSLPIEPDWSTLLPYLEGREVNGLLQTPDQPRIFVTSPPDVLIPLLPTRDPLTSISRWRLLLNNTVERSIHSIPLLELSYTIEKDLIRVPLAQSGLITADSSGLYILSLRGPLGSDASFSFAVLPRLEIHLSPQDLVRLPDHMGLVTSPQIMLTISDSVNLESSDEGVTIRNERSGRYIINVPSRYRQVRLMLSSKQQQKARFKIPLILPLPVIQWTFIEGQQALLQEENWQYHPLILPFAQIEQAQNPRLRVSLTPSSNDFAVSGRLCIYYNVDADPHILYSRGRTGNWLTFQISEAFDSIRSSRNGSTLFQLELDDLPGHKNCVQLPVLRCTQSLDVRDLTLDHCQVDDMWMFSLTRQGDWKLRHRHLRFWPLWRPWLSPIIFPIPNDVKNEFDIFGAPVAKLPPGEYRIEMTLLDPWTVNTRDIRPGITTHGTIEVLLGQDQREYLKQLPYTVEGILERALAIPDIAARLRLMQMLRETVQQPQIVLIFEALLVLIEKVSLEQEQPELFTYFQHILLQQPIKLLAVVAQHSLPYERQVRWEFEELLAKLAPASGLSQFLNQIHLSGSITVSDLADIVPDLKDNADAKADVFATLLEAGISVQEQGDEFRLADVQSDTTLVDLYAGLTEYHLDAARQYLQEICLYPLLTAQREHHLALLCQEGRAAKREQIKLTEENKLLQRRAARGKQAGSELIVSNLRLVVSLAKKYTNRGREFLDLIQDGNLGLMRAVEKFDPGKGTRFSTYATFWIRQSISRHFLDQSSLIRLPMYVHEEIYRVKREKQNLLLVLERDPTDEELAEQLQLPIEKVRELQQLILDQNPLSLDAPVGSDIDTTIGNVFVLEGSDPQNGIHDLVRAELIERLFHLLKPRERLVLERRFGFTEDGQTWTLEQIGRELNITRERVRQIEENALKRIRKSFLQDVDINVLVKSVL